jgi:hypothetical protein
MHNRGQILFGGLLLLLGLITLLGAVFEIDAWSLCWPAGLIALGILLLIRPRVSLGGVPTNIRPFGDLFRAGAWQVQNEEYWTFVGDIKLDFTQAYLPPGETTISILGFVGDVEVTVPPELALKITSTAFMTDSRIKKIKQDNFLTGLYHVSPGYETAEQKLHLRLTYFVVDLDVYEA